MVAPLGLGLVVEDKPTEFSCIDHASMTITERFNRGMKRACTINLSSTCSQLLQKY